MFRPAPLHMAYRAAELIVMHAVGVWLLLSGWWAAAILVLGIAQGRCGWFMHEAGHYSVTGVPSLDRRIQEFAYGVGCGMSAAFWRNQHNKHHATPQQLGKDVDLDTLPLVAFNKEVRPACRARAHATRAAPHALLLARRWPRSDPSWRTSSGSGCRRSSSRPSPASSSPWAGSCSCTRATRSASAPSPSWAGSPRATWPRTRCCATRSACRWAPRWAPTCSTCGWAASTSSSTSPCRTRTTT